MALTMTRPTKHPKTGIYRLRKQIPAPLQDTAAKLFGVRREFIISLNTKDPDEARQRAPSEVARLEARMAALRCAAGSDTSPLTAKQVEAVAGRVYREEAVKWDDDPGSPSDWETARWVAEDRAEYIDITPERAGDPPVELVFRASTEDLQDAVEAIAQAELIASEPDIKRVAEAIARARWELAHVMERRAKGDWRPDENVGRFPVLEAAARQTPSEPTHAPGPTMDRLLEGWALDRGWTMNTHPMPRALYDRLRTMERLAEFLGHRDADAVTKADVVRWKEDMQERGRKVPTIRNDISEMSAIWKGALRQDKLKHGVNPFDGVAPPKPKRQKKGRRAFTGEEAVQILTAARRNSGYMRWLPWVCCLTGARLSEVCQGTREDVTEIDGVVVLRIHDEGTDDQGGVQSLKNADSRRLIPLHPALIAEGFLDYVQALPARSPLFPDAKPDKLFGLRSTNAGKKISRWLKADLKIDDHRISPNHSWRHWFIDACRKVTMNAEVRSALTGHSAARDESANYGDGMKSMVQVLAENIGKVRCPVGNTPAPMQGAQRDVECRHGPQRG